MSLRLGFACLVGLLTVTAALLLATDGRRSPRREEFQDLVGGLGLGPAADWSRCGASFDARLCPDCPLNHGPVPGGVRYCPQHATSVFDARRPGR